MKGFDNDREHLDVPPRAYMHTNFLNVCNVIWKHINALPPLFTGHETSGPIFCLAASNLKQQVLGPSEIMHLLMGTNNNYSKHKSSLMSSLRE